jgi:hypothetical protein
MFPPPDRRKQTKEQNLGFGTFSLTWEGEKIALDHLMRSRARAVPKSKVLASSRLIRGVTGQDADYPKQVDEGGEVSPSQTNGAKLACLAREAPACFQFG